MMDSAAIPERQTALKLFLLFSNSLVNFSLKTFSSLRSLWYLLTQISFFTGGNYEHRAKYSGFTTR